MQLYAKHNNKILDPTDLDAPRDIYTQCKSRVDVQTSIDMEEAQSLEWLVCRDSELLRLFPNSSIDRGTALLNMRKWQMNTNN